jgi:hypothetical protein
VIPIEDHGFWPVTGAGWIGFVVSIITAVAVSIGSFIAYGKWLGKMNGFGGRLKKVEDKLTEVSAIQDERGKQFQRILDQHEALISQVAESKKRAEQCSDEFEDHAVLLGSKIDELKNQSSRLELTISQRLTAVETELKLARSDG